MCHNVKRGLKNKNATKVLTIQKESGSRRGEYKVKK
jgi:hypothetical protein